MGSQSVVLLHGTRSSKRQYQSLSNYLKEKGLKVYEFSYNDKINPEIEGISTKLATFVNKIKDKNLTLIGISKGGIIASYAIELLGLKNKVKKCITLCSPFHGSLVSLFFKNSIELRYGSELLRKLREKVQKSKVRYYTIWNPMDLLVFPGISASLKNPKIMIAPFHYTTLRWTARKFILEKIRE